MPKCYNEIYRKGEAYNIGGRIARYWGSDVDMAHGQRRNLVFFDVETDECIEVPPCDRWKIRSLAR